MQSVNKTHTVTFIVGIFIGIANAIPGVSGGTIAVICNVYDMLLLIASFNIKKIKAAWKKISLLGCGIIIGVLGFSNLITGLYILYPVQINYFFIGIIVGSLSFLYNTVRNAIMTGPADYSAKKRRIKALLCGIAGLVLIGSIYYAQRKGIQAASLQITHSFSSIMLLFCLGGLASFAMLIPGLSGSFILLIFGAYRPIMQAIATFDLLLLLPTGFGICSGLLLGSRLISFFLEKFPAAVYSAILGLALGSILFLLPKTCQPLFMRLISAVVLMVGYSITTFFSRKTNNPPIERKIFPSDIL